ncbi:sodium:proton antiporter NhaD [Fontimonas sp. SYSU GA230001]|uniref:sodium:proton antiporter NhaD n=1 Tax=Fontimonas sp. SYSU GA230001 TaxID=3142450 RepID=UPI0032B5B9BA
MRIPIAVLALLAPSASMASSGGGALDLTTSWIGVVSLALFVAAYAMVVLEEWSGMRKSIPVLLAAGFIWTLIGIAYIEHGDHESAGNFVRSSLLEYGELLLFLLVAMTYVNTLQERNVFEALRGWLVSRGFSLRVVFWLTGAIAFLMSPLADNMTTALVLASVAIAVGKHEPRFVVVACINVVVAANAGGAFSPFGDITTLMVWQKGVLDAGEFLALLVPSLVNWLVPAFIMSLAVPKEIPPPMQAEFHVKRGGFLIIFMFILTVAVTVTMHTAFHLPPALGMMGGLGVLKLYGWLLSRQAARQMEFVSHDAMMSDHTEQHGLNTFREVARAEWDTLLFFYGIILCVGGLGTLGYLAVGSQLMYEGLGPMTANILVGIVSAVIDNIPVMYAVLTMNPAMSDGHWLLVTLTAGVGGSLLSIGSAAGVAVMGQAHGIYTFFSHLRWSWAIALGYAASIAVHYWMNHSYFAPGCC